FLAERARPALVDARDRVERVVALFVVDRREAGIQATVLDAARAVVGVEVVGGAAADFVQARVARREPGAAADVVARLLAIAARVGESIDRRVVDAALLARDALARGRAGRARERRVLVGAPAREQQAEGREGERAHRTNGLHDRPGRCTSWASRLG